MFAASAFGQSFIPDVMRESARSDRVTGGKIVKGTLVPGEGNLKITINVPSFQLTLWQSGKEIKVYPIGVGMKDFPVYIGRLKASSVEWNPVWIPPSSDWIDASSTVKPGEIVLPTDPRNPLGKVKIPLGYGYLIHQAKGAKDLGSLVSHGCIRVMQADLYDLAEKIVAARGLDITPEQIASAKSTKVTAIRSLDPPIPVEITYDTMVVENGRLHVYPDVYELRKNTVENLRHELESSGLNGHELSDAAAKKILARVTGRQQFAVKTSDIESGQMLARGQVMPVVGTAPAIKQRLVQPIKKSRPAALRP
jgi:hypothetical protein